MIINRQRLQRTLAKKVPPVISKKIFNELEQEFEQAKEKMLREFESHTVTKELEGGQTSTNLSSTLGGEGNLYSFIGFAGENALAELRELLVDGIKIVSKRVDKNKLIFTVRIAIPDGEKIAAATPMPWAPGISWAEGIEKGISGLGNFLNKTSSQSRSGKGIQIDFDVRGNQFSPTPYMTKILEDFVSALTQIK